ncbi:MAG: helix-turn-helix transcriptional regulator [Clostridia bacterium]|jgi:transcriptional regulator with XRE-family HTH domain|nr:helix-turn-helix transcriptional regulator [Clostridia bacterium]
MDETELGQIIGKNITRLRKIANMTQLELAEKLNYSDKSVSKWEQGNGIPDVRILMQIAELFGVTLDDLVHEQREHKLMPRTLCLIRRTVIISCSALLVWLVAVVAFVLLRILSPDLGFTWLSFVYAVPVSFVIVLVFACIWKFKWLRAVSVSVIIWTALACVYLTIFACKGLIAYTWLIFFIGIPLQLLTLFFLLGWKKLKFFKKK